VPALFNLAILRSEEGDSQGAIGLYRRVIAVEPDNAGALLNLGILLLTTGEEAEATEMIQRAVELNPSLQQSAGTAAPTTPTTSTDSSGSTVAPAPSD
jgi:Flp pilus assembly protein TadD